MPCVANFYVVVIIFPEIAISFTFPHTFIMTCVIQFECAILEIVNVQFVEVCKKIAYLDEFHSLAYVPRIIFPFVGFC